MSEKVMLHNTMLPYEKLLKMAQDGAPSYKTAYPYAHAVFDDVFDEVVLDKILEEFEEGDKNWYEFNRKYEKKLMVNSDLQFGPVTRAFFHNLNSAPFLEFLEKLTGIKGLIPDPYFVGAGLHKIPRGGKLGIHVDFNRHKKMKLFRRLNVLVYLNKDWKEEYGGHFELWDENKGSCQKKLLPIYNRMALFNTTNTSFHGHPIPLNCPDGQFRKSLALYYYSAENDDGKNNVKAHGTVFLDADGKRVQTHITPLHKRFVRKLSSLFTPSLSDKER